MSALPFQGGVHVDRHSHFTLKQLRLPVVNETHTNSYTGPRLVVLIREPGEKICFANLTVLNLTVFIIQFFHWLKTRTLLVYFSLN
jgi:hypothetical protein